ncbi:MAG: cell division protein FtsA [Bacillota bacterium]
MNEENFIFALDIGTRTIIGVVIEPGTSGYKIIDSEVVEHQNRAMLDGQIHNVREVASQVKRVKENLEQRLDLKLEKVSLAAAGRALETKEATYVMDFSISKNITEEDVQTLELSAVQKAQSKLAGSEVKTEPAEYHFVGYSVIEYKLEGMHIGDLVGQKGSQIEVKLIATFLPRIVVDSLINVINSVNLEIDYMTLEPIAAASLVVPREMYHFNLALIDMGAGTTDIALTRGGSMIGFGMVPEAGDEITEVVAEKFLLEYKAGEKVKRKLSSGKKEIITKNVLGKEIKIKIDNFLEVIEPRIEKLTELISEKIFKINQKSPQALICIGGGSLTPFFIEKLSTHLEIDRERIGVKGIENLDNIEGEIKEINQAQAVTPVGIGKISHESSNKTVFINVKVNNSYVQLFSLKEPTVADALLSAEIDIEDLQPSPGKGITCNVNGEIKTIKGSFGKSGELLINGEKAELEDIVKSGDNIKFIPGENGQDAKGIIKDVLDNDILKSYNIEINNEKVELKPEIYQNGKKVDLNTAIEDGADINYKICKTIGEAVAEVMGVSLDKLSDKILKFKFNGQNKNIIKDEYIIKDKLNNKIVQPDKPIQDGLKLKLNKKRYKDNTVKSFLDYNNKTSCEIYFNGSKLEIPVDNYKMICNGKKIDLNYEIQNGDHIEFVSASISIKDVLDYIDFKLSDAMKEKVDILLNGTKVDLSSQIEDGDKLEIKYTN